MVSLMVKTFIITLMLSVCAAEFKLDMALDSIDHDFEDCRKEDIEALTNYFKTELLTKEKFRTAWDKFKGSTDPYSTALKVYSDKDNGIYAELNNAMRTGRPGYPAGFRYVSLHYLITRGIQTLNVLEKKPKTTYRRTDLTFKRSAVGDKLRFGSFASTSLKRDLVEFGETTCFAIETRFGAEITKLSEHQDEEEVLIPPYEVFTIKAVEGKGNRLGCEVLYTLESAGKTSNMKCSLVGFNSAAKL